MAAHGQTLISVIHCNALLPEHVAVVCELVILSSTQDVVPVELLALVHAFFSVRQ